MKPEKIEETVCNCGAGHGSHEGHTAWCNWLKVERHALLAQAAAEMLAVPSLGAIRIQGQMMKRAEVSAALSE